MVMRYLDIWGTSKQNILYMTGLLFCPWSGVVCPVERLVGGVEGSLGHAGTVLGLLQLLLSLAELGQVEGGDLLRLLNLLLVGLDLLLQLASQLGHAVLVLLVLINLELELLAAALGLLVTLHVLASVGLSVAQLNLQLPDPGLQIGQGSAASTHGGVVGLGTLVLKLGQLSLQGSLGLGQSGGVVLLSAELIGQTGGINHGLLGLLLRVLGLVRHVVNLSVQGVDSALDAALLSGGAGVDGGHLIDSIPGLAQLSLGLPLATLGRVQKRPGLLHLPGESVGTAVSKAGLLSHLLADTGLLGEGALSLPHLALVALDGLLGLVVGLVGVIQSNLQLVDLTLKLLLDPQTLSLGALLRLKGGLHGVHGSGMVLASILELFLLLSDLAVDLLLDLSQLQLSSQHLVLLGLQSTLGLLQGGLQLLLLSLQTAPLLVQLVDGAASVSQLVQQVLDLVSQVLVLPADHIQLLHHLVMGGLQAEHLGAVVAGLGPAGVQLGHQVVSLALPLPDNLVKVVGALLGDDGSGVSALVLHGDLLQLGLQAVLALLGGGNLGVEAVNGLLSLHDAAAQLGLATLQLVNAAKSLGLILGLPQLDLSLGLGQSLQGVILLLILLVNAHAQVLALGAEHLELGQQRSSVASLGVSKLLGVLQLGGQGDLVLAEVADGVLSLLILPGQILGLNLQLLPGGVSLIEGASMLIQLGVGLNNESLCHLAVPLHVGTLPHGLVKTSTGVHEITLHGSLVLLGLGLVLVERVNVLAHLAHGVVVLGPHGGQGALVLDVGLLQLHLQLGQLGLALLVQLNLGASVGSSLIKTTAQVLDVTGQDGPVLLSLGSGLPLNDKLLIQFINASLQLLDLLGVLAAKSVLVLNLGADRGKLLLLPHESLLELRPDTLQIRDSLLGQLEVSLNLPLHLLNISLALLLTLKSVL